MFSLICKSYQAMERHETKGEMTKNRKGRRIGKKGGRRQSDPRTLDAHEEMRQSTPLLELGVKSVIPVPKRSPPS